MTFKEIIQHIVVPPDYHYHHFFCPVKKVTIMAAWSSIFVWVSFELHEMGVWLSYFSQFWSIIAKVLSRLILIMNFIMVAMALAKRVRDWKKPEPEEGSEEFEKRNKK